jgi:nicotinate-nucleotide pyrophosphorylase (carboxylating)
MEEFRPMVRAALEEDIASGDATSLAVIPEDATATAQMVARHDLVTAGISLAQMAFEERSAGCAFSNISADSARVTKGRTLLTIKGPARAILEAERVALNFVQHLSGVATLTRRFVDAIEGTKSKILDTRKTLPGWRKLEKYAVACGGGVNHRIGLYDMVMIKDNHLATLRNAQPNAIGAAVAAARARWPNLKIEVEVDTLEQVSEAVAARADIILLDNMPPETLQSAVRLIGPVAKTEASGGVNLQTVRAIAETGVDFISVGAITHSAPAADIALDFEVHQ